MPVKTMAMSEAVGGGDDVVDPYGAAGLNDGGGAGFGGFFDAVGEWEEGVGRDDAALQRGSALSSRRV